MPPEILLLIVDVMFGDRGSSTDVNAPDRTAFDFYQDWYGDEVDTERFPVSSSLTALHWAAFFGNEDVMRLLIGRGANTNARADVGTRSYLIEEEYYETDEDEGDRTDERKENEIDEWEEAGLSSTHPQRAMFCHTNKEYGQSQYGGHYSEYFSCLEKDDSFGGANALFFALKSLHGWSEVLRWRKRSVYSDEQFARRARGGWRLSMAKLLIEHGSSLTTRECGQIHALHQASAYGQTDIVKLLIDELGTDPNIRDKDNNTPLHYVAIDAMRRQGGKAGDMQIQDLRRTTQLLLDRGADPCLQNFKGLTAEKAGLSRWWLERA
ncbi:unnamed protein product [Colletotrichum noveboracense]|uniref:Ankyrin repeat protein n=1 Tax=Colletotrichum noveboracense TaxID=2664923 RepID=A0A9W4S6M1_9PEZI|nr:unnamed protein product [Colletotrichum noveboracense]